MSSKLIVIGGLPGTGKTSLAAGLARTVDAVHVRIDDPTGASHFQAVYARELPPPVKTTLDLSGDTMSIEHYTDPSQPATLPFSAAVKVGDPVFVSGQVAKGDDDNIVAGDIEAHMRQTLRSVERALDGCSLRDVVKVTVWLQDASDFASFNRVYAEFSPGATSLRAPRRM
jgi:2-iminobutanoate/2-iminopropanoate deaminase